MFRIVYAQRTRITQIWPQGVRTKINLPWMKNVQKVRLNGVENGFVLEMFARMRKSQFIFIRDTFLVQLKLFEKGKLPSQLRLGYCTINCCVNWNWLFSWILKNKNSIH